MKRHLPPLVPLRAFEAVARTGSIRAAGEELVVSHTVISRHVRNLEARLGVKLLEARGRRLVLTVEGARFHAQITLAFDAIARATAELHPVARGALEIWCIPGIANRRVMPRLPELEARLPGWQIALQPTLSRPDLARGEADAEIVYLDGVEPREGLRAELLARPRVFPVASPALLARHANVTTVADLLRLPLIHEESTEQWDRWLDLAGVAAPPPLRGTRLWHAHLAIEAARLGQGVAIANDLLAEEDLTTGTLVEVVPSSVRFGGYHFVAIASRWTDPAMVTLRGWLREVFAPALGTGA